MTKKLIKVMTIVVTLLFVCVFAFTAQAQTATKDEGEINLSDIYTQQILDKADIEVDDNDRIIRTDGKGCIAITIVTMSLKYRPSSSITGRFTVVMVGPLGLW